VNVSRRASWGISRVESHGVLFFKYEHALDLAVRLPPASFDSDALVRCRIVKPPDSTTDAVAGVAAGATGPASAPSSRPGTSASRPGTAQHLGQPEAPSSLSKHGHEAEEEVVEVGAGGARSMRAMGEALVDSRSRTSSCSSRLAGLRSWRRSPPRTLQTVDRCARVSNLPLPRHRLLLLLLLRGRHSMVPVPQEPSHHQARRQYDAIK